MEAVATKAVGAAASTVVTKLASQVVSDGIDIVEEKEGKRAKFLACTVLLALLLALIYTTGPLIRNQFRRK